MKAALRRPGFVPLVRALSKLGFASRTHARVLITQGRVRVNGSVITDPSAHIVPERARIAIDEIAQTRQERRVLILHKPRGVVTTRRDPDGRRTVFDVLGEAGRGLVAVGRLDRASTGLLVFTNDTAFANWMTDPKNRVRRRYVITVRGRLTADEAGAIRQGIDVPTSGGQLERLSVSELEIRKTSARETHLIVTLVEGKNREIRRLFKAVGHEVTRLHRVSFGDFQLGALQPGESREV